MGSEGGTIMTAYLVKALQLNLRSAPNAGASNRIAVLSQGTRVTKVADAAVAGWWEVDAEISNQLVRGFVNASYLGPLDTSFPVGTASGNRLPPADLGSSRSAKRSSRGGWAYSIGEANKPGRAKSHPQGKAAGIAAIIDWLNVGEDDHLRWWPSGSTTYCNVYTYDVCTLAGCYLPRVWWTSSAIRDLTNGRDVEARYGSTVNEMTANYIFNWLEEYGADFGWKRRFDLDEIQDDANGGRVSITCAQRTQMNRPGHIQIVAPEHGDKRAKRVDGKVTQPLQSNAGASNFTYGQLGQSWWKSASFREFGFWSADPS